MYNQHEKFIPLRDNTAYFPWTGNANKNQCVNRFIKVQMQYTRNHFLAAVIWKWESYLHLNPVNQFMFTYLGFQIIKRFVNSLRILHTRHYRPTFSEKAEIRQDKKIKGQICKWNKCGYMHWFTLKAIFLSVLTKCSLG